ncbi:MAG: 50S ribosomal protein L32 [Patescibacteria group bacterium]|nr:50S ribosomal protein L32 [Patescibacteria group bacterium]
MSVPKQRHTKGRRNRRRANIKIVSKKFVSCSHCSKEIMKHKICPYCGYYKGKEVIDTTKRSAKKKSKKEKK